MTEAFLDGQFAKRYLAPWPKRSQASATYAASPR